MSRDRCPALASNTTGCGYGVLSLGQFASLVWLTVFCLWPPYYVPRQEGKRFVTQRASQMLNVNMAEISNVVVMHRVTMLALHGQVALWAF